MARARPRDGGVGIQNLEALSDDMLLEYSELLDE